MKIKDYIIKNIYNIFLIIAILVLFLVNLFELKHRFNVDVVSGKKYYILFIAAFIILSVITLLLYKITNKKIDNHVPKVFLISAFILGCIFTVLSPLFTGSDEHNHYYRIYEITEGIFVTPTEGVVGSELPDSLQNTFSSATGNNTTIKYKHIKGMNEIDLNKDEKSQYGDLFTNSYNNTALYSPIQYLPQVIGFMIGKVLNLKPLYIGMLGRIFNLLFYIVLGYLCLKIIPKAKMFYLLILLSPNMLQCATTLSADAFTNCIFLLILAWIWNICCRDNKIKRIEEVTLFGLSILISLCKIVYLPIVFLLLVIDKEKFKKNKIEKIIFVVITLLVSAIVSLLWMKCTNGVFEIAYDKTELQKQYIFSNLFEYVFVLIRTYMNYIVKYMECLFVGTTMYHSQLEIPAIISFIYIIYVIIALIKEKYNNDIKIINRIIIGCVGVIIIGLVSTAIYVQCTAQYYSVGHATIEGIQGRYFIPIVFLVPLLINPIKKKMEIENNAIYKGVLSINLITFLYMINQFMH